MSQHQTLQKQFSADVISLGGSQEQASRWHNVLVNRYTETHRHYHTLSHIEAMLTNLEADIDKIFDPLTVRLAIYFHDIIYDPTKTDNEEQSIRVWEEFVADVGVEQDRATLVKEYIKCTVTHTLPFELTSGPQLNDLQYFLDFDLEVLSRSDEEYDTYREQIRQEYIHYPDEAYRKGRSAVLTKFLERERLYFSEWFGREREGKARENLKKEIGLLKSP